MKHVEFCRVLKLAIRAKGYNYSRLATELGVAESSVKRWFSTHSLSMERTGQILEVINLEFSDIAGMMDQGQRGFHILTDEQEAALANDRTLFRLFHGLQFGKKASQLATPLGLTPNQLEQSLLSLDSLQLITLSSNMEPSPKFELINWQSDGPLFQEYGDVILRNYIGGDFLGGEEAKIFLSRSLSKESQKLILGKFEKLRLEIEDRSKIDQLGKGELFPVSVFLGQRLFTLDDLD